MAKKLLVFSLVLFFLLAVMTVARVDNVITKSGEKVQPIAPREKISKINLPDNPVVAEAVKKVEEPVVEAEAATAIDPEGDVIPASVPKVEKPTLLKKRGYLYPGDPQIVPAEKAAGGPHGYLFNYDDEQTEYYLSGGTAGDEWGIWFQSTQAACSLYAVEFTFYAPQGGGTINLDVMQGGSVDPSTVLNPDSIAVEDVFGDNLMGVDESFPLEIAATSDWEQFVFPDWGYEIDVGRDVFWIHWIKTGDAPMLLADDNNPGDALHTWSYEPVQDNDEKWSHYGASVGIEAMVRCEVIFYEDPPPVVQGVQMNDTYRTDAITLTAAASDNALDPDLKGIDSGKLYYSLNGGDYVEVAATVSGSNEDGWTLSADVPAGVSGDVYEYYFEATDLAGLVSRSFPALTFQRTEPANPDADLLIIADSDVDAQADHDLYRYFADEAGLVYEYWDADERNGIDESVVGFGPTNIIVYGWGTNTVPVVAGETDPGYGTFLDNGGNLALIDQDWFFSHGLVEEPEFVAGDFAYDYFGIVAGANDPNDGTNSTADTVFYGQDVTPMDSPFTEANGGMTIQHGMMGTLNWGDYFDATNATVIFVGANDGNTYGSVKEGTFKAVCLGFMMDAAIDTTEDGDYVYDAVGTFLDGLFTYFAVESPPRITDVSGPLGTVLAGPYAVSATIIDSDDDAITAVLKYGDDGETWTSVDMTADGDTYSAEIPNMSEAGIYYWYIEATAASDVSTWPDAVEGPAVFERFVPRADVLVAFNGMEAAGYPGAYYFGKGDYTNYGTLWFSHDVWEKALSAELLSAYTTVYEITTGGPNWDNRAAVTTWLAEGAKNYFLCGDEWLGALSGWTDLDFTSGDFEYDVLGLTHSYNDVNYYYHAGSGAPSEIEAVDGNDLTGELYTAHTAIPDTLLYDPVYEIEVSNWLDAFDVVDDGNTNVCMTTDTTEGGTAAIGVNRTVGDDKVVFLGFDPLSINAAPYTWWGFALESPQSQSLEWFGVDWYLAVDQKVSEVPEEFKLSQNYPNPFNPSTSIDFALPEAANVQIAVYNMLGQKVAELINRSYQPGQYHVIWDGKDLNGNMVSSGIYIYRMTAGDFTKTNKMIFLK